MFTGQIITTSAEVTLNCGLVRESLHNLEVTPRSLGFDQHILVSLLSLLIAETLSPVDINISFGMLTMQHISSLVIDPAWLGFNKVPLS